MEGVITCYFCGREHVTPEPAIWWGVAIMESHLLIMPLTTLTLRNIRQPACSMGCLIEALARFMNTRSLGEPHAKFELR